MAGAASSALGTSRVIDLWTRLSLAALLADGFPISSKQGPVLAAVHAPKACRSLAGSPRCGEALGAQPCVRGRIVGIPDKGRGTGVFESILRMARIPAGAAARGSEQRDGD